MSGTLSNEQNAEDAFRALYDANHERVRRFLARAAGPQEAEDLAQVVFAKAARSLLTFRGDAQASTWLYRIAANVVSDWLRGRSIREAKSTVALPDGADDAGLGGDSSTSQARRSSPEQELIREEMGDCIRRLIGDLPDRHRSVLVLGELGSLTDSEVAEALGISRGNAKVRLHRARAQLKNAFEANCNFSRDEQNEFVCEPKATHCHPR